MIWAMRPRESPDSIERFRTECVLEIVGWDSFLSFAILQAISFHSFCLNDYSHDEIEWIPFISPHNIACDHVCTRHNPTSVQRFLLLIGIDPWSLESKKNLNLYFNNKNDYGRSWLNLTLAWLIALKSQKLVTQSLSTSSNLLFNE